MWISRARISSELCERTVAAGDAGVATAVACTWKLLLRFRLPPRGQTPGSCGVVLVVLLAASASACGRTANTQKPVVTAMATSVIHRVVPAPGSDPRRRGAALVRDDLEHSGRRVPGVPEACGGGGDWLVAVEPAQLGRLSRAAWMAGAGLDGARVEFRPVATGGLEGLRKVGHGWGERADGPRTNKVEHGQVLTIRRATDNTENTDRSNDQTGHGQRDSSER